jgi:Na+/glutamate symporter
MRNPEEQHRAGQRITLSTLIATFALFLLTIIVGRQLAEFAPLLDLD